MNPHYGRKFFLTNILSSIFKHNDNQKTTVWLMFIF
jgi:hypothetical protein